MRRIEESRPAIFDSLAERRERPAGLCLVVALAMPGLLARLQLVLYSAMRAEQTRRLLAVVTVALRVEI